MSAAAEPTGYIHILCGAYAVSNRFQSQELASLQARDPKSFVRCPECEVRTESRSYLPTYKTDVAAAPDNNATRASQGA